MAGGMLGRNDCYSLAECVDTTVQPGSSDNRPVALTQGKRGRSADRAFPCRAKPKAALLRRLTQSLLWSSKLSGWRKSIRPPPT